VAGAAMAVLAVLNDLASVVGVSTFALLFYYAMANISAMRLKAESRVYPKYMPAIGLASCLFLLPFISPSALMTTLLCFAVGIMYYGAR